VPSTSPLDHLLSCVRACQACADKLPAGPRPILQVDRRARILVASQAPGSVAHASGIPFSDASGARLREWMGISQEQFYDPALVAIVPLGLCYPGKARAGGDSPPMRECAPLWRRPLLNELPNLRLTLLVGSHIQQHELGAGSMTDRVREFRRYLPRYFPLPHPSWRSTLWMRQNPWFEAGVLPALRSCVRRMVDNCGD
jgi:uracil-DNA glycosylase